MRYLTNENKDKIGIYFNPGETQLTADQMKKRRMERRFLKSLDNMNKQI